MRNATIEVFQRSGSEWLCMPASNVFIMNNLSSSANLEINTQYATVSGNIYSFPNYRTQITFPDIVGKRGQGSKDVILTVDNITYTGLFGSLAGNLRLFEYSDFWNGFYTQSSSNAALNMDINISIEDAEDDESIGLIFYDIDVATPGYPEMVIINSGLIGQPVIPADHHDIGFDDASLSYYANDGSAEGEGSFRCGVSFLGKANETSIHWQGAIGCGTFLGITSGFLPTAPPILMVKPISLTLIILRYLHQRQRTLKRLDIILNIGIHLLYLHATQLVTKSGQQVPIISYLNLET